MSTRVVQKPVPIVDASSAPFFAGARDGRLLLLRCGACGVHQSPTAYFGVPRRPRCVECFADALDWSPAGGRATLHSFALMHQRYDEAFADEIPYNVAVVETEEGVRLTGQVVDCANEALAIGMALEVVFEPRSDDVSIPMWRPAA